MTIIRVFVAVVVASLFILANERAIGDMYKYKDKFGIEHIVESPPQNISHRSTVNKTSDSKTNTVPIVEIYLTSWCPWSNKAKAYFTSRGISFSEYDIEKDTAAKNRKDELDSKKGVPTVVINGKVIHGYDPDHYEKALQRRP